MLFWGWTTGKAGDSPESVEFDHLISVPILPTRGCVIRTPKAILYPFAEWLNSGLS